VPKLLPADVRVLIPIERRVHRVVHPRRRGAVPLAAVPSFGVTDGGSIQLVEEGLSVVPEPQPLLRGVPTARLVQLAHDCRGLAMRQEAVERRPLQVHVPNEGVRTVQGLDEVVGRRREEVRQQRASK